MSLRNISNEAMQVVRANATNGFKQTATQRADGSWDVPLDRDTIDRIEEIRLEGETFSDVIIRIGTLHRSGGKAN